MTKIKPRHDKVVARRAEQSNVTAGGIHIASKYAEKSLEAVVLAVGPGVKNKSGILKPMGVSPGDRILIGNGAGVEVKVDDETLLILPIKEILAVVRNLP